MAKRKLHLYAWYDQVISAFNLDDAYAVLCDRFGADDMRRCGGLISRIRGTFKFVGTEPVPADVAAQQVGRGIVPEGD